MGNGTATAAHLVEITPEGHVKPKKIDAEGTDIIRIFNGTNDTIKIHVGKSEAFKKVREDIPKGKEGELIAENVSETIECSYAVFCMDKKDFAHGSAMPIIIVKPKT